MGLFDVFKGNNKEEKTEKSHTYESDIKYTNKDGLEIEINVKDLVEQEGKILQNIYISHTKNGVMAAGKFCLMEPKNLNREQNGEYTSQTKEYLKSMRENKPDFLEKFVDFSEIENLKTNYIGEMEEYKGNYIRSRDVDFEEKYATKLEKEKIEAAKPSMQKDLESNVYKEGENIESLHNPKYDVGVLSQDMLENRSNGGDQR